MQQRDWLRNSQIPGLRARESSESMYGCHPRPYHCLPRRSRRDHPYAGLAIGKGHITRALTRWAVIRQQFSLFLLKRAPASGVGASLSGCNAKRLFSFLPPPPMLEKAFPDQSLKAGGSPRQGRSDEECKVSFTCMKTIGEHNENTRRRR